MYLDIATLCFLLSFTSALVAIGLFLQATISKNLPSVIFWAFGYTGIAAGSLFLLIRHFFFSNWIVIFISDALILLGILLISQGVSIFFEKKDKQRMLILIFTVSNLALLYFSVVNDSTSSRSAVFSLAAAAISFITVFDLWNHNIKTIKISSRILSILFFLYAVFLVIRSVASLSYPNEGFFLPSIFQTSLFLLSITCSILWAFALVIMINQKIHREKEQVQEHFFVIFDTGPDIAMISHFESGKIIDVNKNFSLVTGYQKKEVLGKTTTEIRFWQSKEERDKFLNEIDLAGYCDNFEMIVCKKNGDTFTGLISSKRIELQGEPHLISLIRDISDRKKLEDELKQQAHYDMLTEIYNRGYFIKMAEQELRCMNNHSKGMAYFMLDMDHFKVINDTFGHSLGDVALKVVAKTCKDTLRDTDLLGRIGGEEFAAFIPVSGEEEALEVAERLRHNVEKIRLFHHDGTPVHLNISIGVTLHRPGKDSLEELMTRSDRALYRAKEKGRNCVVLF